MKFGKEKLFELGIKNLWNLSRDPPVSVSNETFNESHHYLSLNDNTSSDQADKIIFNFSSKLEVFDFSGAEGIKQYSKVGWIEDRGLALELAQKIKESNYFFNMRLRNLSECIEYREYDDTYVNETNWFMDVQGNNCHRKLSAIMFLSDPSEYEGGELWMITSAGTNKVDENRKGSIIVFPSYLLYRFTGVTQGKLRTLMFWADGPKLV
jgi:hypothetical protein